MALATGGIIRYNTLCIAFCENKDNERNDPE